MMVENVLCDKCGVKIPKSHYEKWHSLRVDKHKNRNVSSNVNNKGTTFHMCSSCLSHFLNSCIGHEVTDEHMKDLHTQIRLKLSLLRNANGVYEIE